MSSSRTTKSAVDQDAVSRNWRERGFSCGLWIEPPGQVFFTHELPAIEALAEHSDFFWRVGLAQLKKLMER